MQPQMGIGQKRLIDGVIKKGLCVRCGACVGFCPYFSFFDGQVVVTDMCQADSERCARVCPVAATSASSLRANQTGEGAGMGTTEEILMARAARADIRDRSQYGGVVSALMGYALEKGRIQSAILTTTGDAFSPRGVEVWDQSGIARCSGSRYTASGSLSALNRALKQGHRQVGVVGLPCQMTALGRMSETGSEEDVGEDAIALKIGLFCTWALDHRKIADFLKAEGAKGPFLKWDIPPPPAEVFQVRTEDGWREFPLSDIRPYVQKGCQLCEDMTAEESDISVGAVEGMEGWNTVVLRTRTGSRLLGDAVKDGWIETGRLPQENLDHLKGAARNKRERGRNNKNDQ